MGKTIVEKIFDAHSLGEPFPGTVLVALDRVFCHEISTPVAITDLLARRKDTVYDSSRIKAVIDHVAPAKDSKTAMQGKILRDWSRRHGIEFFEVGRNGICHALFPEQGMVRPGFTAVMGDSHTSTLGAFGAFAAGVGTTDLEVALVKGVAAFRKPVSIRLDLNGTLPFGVSAKDVILYILGQLTVSGALDRVLEISGPVVDAMSMSARMTLCNMAVEAGAMSGICLPDTTTVEYLWPFIQNEFHTREAALAAYELLHSDSDAVYEKHFIWDLSGLEPLTTFGFVPDQVKPVRELEGTRVDQVYIGSCTNGRIEDLREAAQILKGRKVASNVRAVISPATTDTYKTALDEGLIKIFVDAGACLTNPSCGACPGMSSGVLAEGEVCASTTNRNFNGRMGKGAMIHLMSPASAAATAVMGTITDPRKLMSESS